MILLTSSKQKTNSWEMLSIFEIYCMKYAISADVSMLTEAHMYSYYIFIKTWRSTNSHEILDYFWMLGATCNWLGWRIWFKQNQFKSTFLRKWVTIFIWMQNKNKKNIRQERSLFSLLNIIPILVLQQLVSFL